MSKKEMEKMIIDASLECNLRKLKTDAEIEIFMNEVYMEKIDREYKDKLRDLELIEEVRRRMTKLLVLINNINDIEQLAIAQNNSVMMWKCEGQQAKLRNQMSIMRSKYDL